MIEPSITTLSPSLSPSTHLDDAQIGRSDLDQAHLVRSVRQGDDDVAARNAGGALSGDQIAAQSDSSACPPEC